MMYDLTYVVWDGDKEVRYPTEPKFAVQMKTREDGYKFLDALKADGINVVRFWFTRTVQ